MSVDCTAYIAYGYVLNNNDAAFLVEKYKDNFWSTLGEDNEVFPFEAFSRNCYNDKIADNCILGRVLIGADIFSSFTFSEINLEEEVKKEIKSSIEELLGHEVKCEFYLFTRWD